VQRSNWDEHNISSIKKLKTHWRTRVVTLSQRKGSFIKDDMPGDDDSVGREVKAAISFVMSGIAKEDTQGGAGGKFV